VPLHLIQRRLRHANPPPRSTFEASTRGDHRRRPLARRTDAVGYRRTPDLNDRQRELSHAPASPGASDRPRLDPQHARSLSRAGVRGRAATTTARRPMRAPPRSDGSRAASRINAIGSRGAAPHDRAQVVLRSTAPVRNGRAVPRRSRRRSRHAGRGGSWRARRGRAGHTRARRGERARAGARRRVRRLPR